MFDKELLKEANCCSYTGVETIKQIDVFNDVYAYESKTQEHHNIRVAYKCNDVTVCCVLLRKHNKSKFDDYVVAGVFTDEHMRLKGFAKSLMVVAKMYVRSEYKAKLCLDNNLTELGKCLFKRGV